MIFFIFHIVYAPIFFNIFAKVTKETRLSTSMCKIKMSGTYANNWMEKNHQQETSPAHSPNLEYKAI
jgi:hypothetical protein